MQIKEAAERAALTERAVRLYEERGLISPHITNKNGRDFRDYNERDLERLKTISALRRALFTIDEIGEMLDDPASIPAITAKNRRRLHDDFAQLAYLTSCIDAVDTSLIADAAGLSRAIFASEDEAPVPAASVVIPDKAELYSEQYRRIYDKYFAENTGWDKRYGASLRVSGVLGRIFSAKAAKVCLITVISVAVIAFLLTHIPYIEDVEYTYTGVCLEYTEDAWLTDITEMEAGETLTVRGNIKHYLFREPTFEGYFEFEDFRNAVEPDEPGRFPALITLKKSHPHPDEIPLELQFLFGGHTTAPDGRRWYLEGTTEYRMDTVIIRARIANYSFIDNDHACVYIFSRTGDMESAQRFYRFAVSTHTI